jgi:hypothetical protein
MADRRWWCAWTGIYLPAWTLDLQDGFDNCGGDAQKGIGEQGVMDTTGKTHRVALGCALPAAALPVAVVLAFVRVLHIHRPRPRSIKFAADSNKRSPSSVTAWINAYPSRVGPCLDWKKFQTDE